MKRWTQFFAVFLAVGALGYAQQQKKRVAVLDFDYATVQSGVSAIFGTNQDVGKGIADLLVDKLVKDGQYSVIERKALDKVLAEQNFSNSNRADSSTAAKIGKILGVEAIIIGSITQFGRDDKKTDIGGGALGGLGRFGIGGGRPGYAQQQFRQHHSGRGHLRGGEQRGPAARQQGRRAAHPGGEHQRAGGGCLARRHADHQRRLARRGEGGRPPGSDAQGA